MVTYGKDVCVVDKHVGQIMRLHRKAEGFSQCEFSTLIGVPLRTLYKFEWGLERPSPKQLSDICITLDIFPWNFFETLNVASLTYKSSPTRRRGVL